MKFEDKYFVKFEFAKEQVNNTLKNALRDLDIAREDKILDVKFSYAYTAFIKGGMALLSFYKVKVKSIPGHHIKIIEKLAQLLDDKDIDDIGNIMRSKRNLDLYSGGVEVTEKECLEYLNFTAKVLNRIKEIVTA
ncbi:MAG: hypothetical protein PHY88_03225 [Candidatus Omnitrophica bacterium]|nr:hypothetical protein [Candidatus Omnitrophota bacterium]